MVMKVLQCCHDGSVRGSEMVVEVPLYFVDSSAKVTRVQPGFLEGSPIVKEIFQCFYDGSARVIEVQQGVHKGPLRDP